jgi:ABC-2 type transport system permease protein
MVYTVNGLRHGLLDVTEVDPTLSLGVLSVAAVVVLLVDVALFERGYGLTD